jgi:hypothetical protein
MSLTPAQRRDRRARLKAEAPDAWRAACTADAERKRASYAAAKGARPVRSYRLTMAERLALPEPVRPERPPKPAPMSHEERKRLQRECMRKRRADPDYRQSELDANAVHLWHTLCDFEKRKAFYRRRKGRYAALRKAARDGDRAAQSRLAAMAEQSAHRVPPCDYDDQPRRDGSRYTPIQMWWHP